MYPSPSAILLVIIYQIQCVMVLQDFYVTTVVTN
jgi:hypothetical protein